MFSCLLPWVALTCLGMSGVADAGEASPRLSALNEPAIMAPKASSAAMMAVARAGARLVAVGERGIVLLSDDIGKVWRQARVPVRTTLTAVTFVDEKSGWAVGHMGVVLHSADGGESWTKQMDGVQAAQLMKSAASADTSPLRTEFEKFAKTLVDDGPDKPFLALHFFGDGKRGIVVGAYNLALTTEDAGATWRALGPHLPNPKGLHLYAVGVAGTAIVIAGEQGLLLRSESAGRDFAAIASPYAGSWFGLLGGPQGELLLYGLRGSVYVSADAGNTFTRSETGVLAAVSGGARLDDGRLALSTQAGTVLESKDQGRTFQAGASTPGFAITDIRQASDGTLVLAGLGGLRRVEAPIAPAAR